MLPVVITASIPKSKHLVVVLISPSSINVGASILSICISSFIKCISNFSPLFIVGFIFVFFFSRKISLNIFKTILSIIEYLRNEYCHYA